MRILITGSNGFLGQKFAEIIKNKSKEITLLGLSKSANRNPYLSEKEFQQIDLTDFDNLHSLLEKYKPSHILHCAAITSVEACEENRELAHKINVQLTLELAKYAKLNQTHLTFISTDFVFDGNNGPYDETDQTNPVNNYGQTKVEAENQLQQLDANIAILRTILVYGAIPDKGRSNLVLWAKNQLSEGNRINVVADQWRMPTWIDDLAEACIYAMTVNAKGIFHISGGEMMTIQEAVETLANTWNFDKTLIHSITANEIGQDKNRPRKTGFNLTKAKNILNYTPTSFVVSLHEIDKQLKVYNA